MSRRNSRVANLSLPITLVVLGFAGCSSERPAATPAQETIRDVSILTTQKATVPDLLEAVGTVRAAHTSDLASQMMGTIVEVRVRAGDRVEQGQVLALIDESQPKAAVEQATAAEGAARKEVKAAESENALAEATMKRYQQLYDKKSISPQEFDEVKSRFQTAAARHEMAQAGQAQAEAALTQAKKTYDYTRIRAPFSGLVTDRKADPGTLASPGLPIFTLEDTRNYRLEASVDESDIRLVRPGQTVAVTVDSLDDKEMQGKVSQIVPAADPGSRTFIVKIDLPVDAKLRSGLFGRANFARGERSVVLIPRTATVVRGQLQGVYVIDQNETANLRYVTLGKSAGPQVEVLSGLQEGERLIVAPGERELGGKRVLVKQ